MSPIQQISSKAAPLCHLPGGGLVCYHRGRICVLRAGTVETQINLRIGGKERLLGWNNWMSRLFRFGIRAAIAIDKNHVLLSSGQYIFELDLVRGELSPGWNCGEGIRPLALSVISEINGFSNGVYFGGYLHNDEKKPVSIYRRKAIDDWEVVFTFPEGVVNHVHSVVADSFRQCVWVLTGDFDAAAAI